MDPRQQKQKQEIAPITGRIPSFTMSFIVLAVMASLILFSVFLFGEEVANGPLQISITMATLFAYGVAYYYGFRGALISEAVNKTVNSTIGTIFILIAIGTIIGALYLSGTAAAFVYYGVELLNAKYFYVIVFIISSVLSVMTGSSFTTIGALGVAFVALATIMGVSPAIAAGAVVSGAFLGDKIAKISDTPLLNIAVVGGITIDEHIRMVKRTAIIPFVISAILYTLLGVYGNFESMTSDPTAIQKSITEIYNISPIAFLPVILIFVLSSLRLSGFLSLMLSAIAAVILAAFTQHDMIISQVNDATLSYGEAVLKLSIKTLSDGFHLHSGTASLDKLFSGGGAWGMFETIWLILMASAFGGILDYTGMIQKVISPVIKWSKNTSRLLLGTALTNLGLNIFAADPYISIVLTGKMYRQEYMKRKIKPVALSTTIADSGTIFSALIPWNVNGAFIAAAVGVGTLSYAPYAFLCYLSLPTTVLIGHFYFRKDKIAPSVDAKKVYGKEIEELPNQSLSA